jgi:hypothetical protein
MKRAGALPLSGGITRPFEPEKTRTGIKKRIGLQASELTGVGDREPLEKRVLPLFIGEILTMRGECSPFTSKLAQHSVLTHIW